MSALAAIIAALCGAGLLVLVVSRRFGAARRGALLTQALESQAPPPCARQDLPPAAIALAARLGARAGHVGRIVRLTQRGEMWLEPGGRAFPFTAQQCIATAQVGFVWRASMAMAPGVALQVIEHLVGGRDGLDACLFGVVPVARFSDGAAAFRGEAMRYLAELMWNPDAILLNRELVWRVVDAKTLVVATGEGDRRSEVRLLLDADGDIGRIEADDRPRAEGRDLVPTPRLSRIASGFHISSAR